MSDKKEQLNMHDLCIVLVEPVYKGNIGFVTRVMNNFSIEDLRIVGKIPEQEEYFVAVHSEEILRNARLCETLDEALTGLDRLVAVSRRHGKYKPVDYRPVEIAQKAIFFPGKTGLVFGRETYGLKDEEADKCHFRCHIPANPEFPSLNLAQSVAVMCYEFYQARQTLKYTGKGATKAEITATLEHIESILEDIGYKCVGDIPKISSILQRTVLKANVNRWDLKELRNMFTRIQLLGTGQSERFEFPQCNENTQDSSS
ncbi:MAG: TrmJ/YjtD family RNA methyltransferase [Candidatus Cloacimonetes bacterium]|nr:TrmJ/YjtD family RNA methyltransferase [Candidatus Cloacimonadota bacterium]